jgi:plasmid stabilization system protein ParE
VKIIWSPLAIERLSTIAAWLAADRPDAAQHLVDGMFSAVGSLSKFPHGGREVPEFQRPDVRESIYKQDRIVYRVSRKSIDILTVRHSLQLLDEHDLGDDPGLSEG